MGRQPINFTGLSLTGPITPSAFGRAIRAVALARVRTPLTAFTVEPTPTQALVAAVPTAFSGGVASGTAITLASSTALAVRGADAAAAVQERLASIRDLFAAASPDDRSILAQQLVLPNGVPARLAHDDPALSALLSKLSSECWLAWKAHNGDFEIMLAVVRAMFEKLQACRVDYPDYHLSAASVAMLYLLCDVPETVIPHAERTQLLRVVATRLPRAVLDPLLDEPLAQVAHLPPTHARALLTVRRELQGDLTPTRASSRADDAHTIVMLGRLRDPEGRTPEDLREAVEHTARVGSVEAIPLLRDVQTVVAAWSVPWHWRGPLFWRNQRTQLLTAITAALQSLATARDALPTPAAIAVTAPATKRLSASAADQRPVARPAQTAEGITIFGWDASGARLYPDLVRLPDGTFHRSVNSNARHWTIADPGVTTVISGVFMSTTTISNAMWMKYLRMTKQKDKRDLPKKLRDARQPAVNVSFDDATAYCKWLTTAFRESGHQVTIQLPSDEEWEYAARAGREAEALYATASGALDDTQAHYGQEWESGSPIAVDVAEEQIPPIEFLDPTTGVVALLYQMAGNVWKWTRSVFALDSNVRSVRGGSWGNGDALACRASFRSYGRHGGRGRYVGFRVVALQDSKKPT